MRIDARARMVVFVVAALLAGTAGSAAAFPLTGSGTLTALDGATAFDGAPALDGKSGSAGAQASFVRAPYRWPRGRIPYFNAARGSSWAVRRAVLAWNRSGARVRFVAVSRRRARLVIRYQPVRRCVGVGFAMMRYDRGIAHDGDVLISRPDSRRAECSRWALAMVTAHELGHALGLEHESRRCAAMNPMFIGLAPAGCPAMHDWEWRCRLLEHDDVRGAVRLYGGRVRTRPDPVCEIFPQPRSPGGASVSPGASPAAVALVFERPPESAAPRHLQPGRAGYAYAAGAERCPALLEARHGVWAVPVGARQQASVLPDRPGRHCFATWTLDAAGRASAASTVWADVGYAPDGSLTLAPVD